MSYEIARQNKNFKDIDLNFKPHPATGDIVKKVGADAVRSAIRNLLFLKLGELGFAPHKGAGMYQYLFEPLTPATVELISQEIKNTITVFEPRAILLNLVISEQYNNKNGLNIDIEFKIKNFTAPFSLRLFLKRVR